MCDNSLGYYSTGALQSIVLQNCAKISFFASQPRILHYRLWIDVIQCCRQMYIYPHAIPLTFECVGFSVQQKLCGELIKHKEFKKMQTDAQKLE